MSTTNAQPTVQAERTTEYFVGVFEHAYTGPASNDSGAIAFVNITTDDDGHPVIDYSNTDYLDAHDLAETRTLETVWHDGDLRIPDATDLRDPTQVAVWGAVAESPIVERCFNNGDIVVFEVDQRREDKQWADMHGYACRRDGYPVDDSVYGTRHDRYSIPPADDRNTFREHHVFAWNRDIAPASELPDAKPFKNATRLVTFRDGQNMHHPLGTYGVSVADTVPLAVRDVLSCNHWTWEPRVHRVSYAATYSPEALLGEDIRDADIFADSG